jgi:hypothetical protein
MGKKSNSKPRSQDAEHQHRRKPWQLGNDWEVYPVEVPGYEAWAPGLPTERLQVTLDGLRQGELWLCKQFEVYAKAVECDMRARDSMLEDHARTISDLQELVRTAGRTIDLLVARDAQLQDMKDALLDSDRSLGRQVSDLQRLAGRTECQMQEVMHDISVMKRHLENQPWDTHGAPFRDQLCDELARLAATLRAPAPDSIEQRIAAAQHSAWRNRNSPALSVASLSRQHSPAPSVASARQ